MAPCPAQPELASSKAALRPGPFLPSLASADVPRRIASYVLVESLLLLISEDGEPLTVDLIMPPGEASLASRHVLRRHCDLARFLPALQPGMFFPALRPLMLFSAMRPTEGGITSADAFRRITSPDVSPGITSSRQRASLPAEVCLTSLVSIANLSILSFSIVFVCPRS